MSEKVKINKKQSRLSIKVKDEYSAADDPVEHEDIFQKQLQSQFQMGLSKGYEAATDELEKAYSDKLSARLKDVHNIAAALEEKITEHEKYYETVIVQLALLIAEKIVKREVAQKTIINEVMKESLKKIIGANNVIVKLNISDFSDIQNEANQILNDSAFTRIKFEPDERIEQGGCFIESEIGNVDARLSTQVNELKKSLESVIARETNV